MNCVWITAVFVVLDQECWDDQLSCLKLSPIWIVLVAVAWDTSTCLWLSCREILMWLTMSAVWYLLWNYQTNFYHSILAPDITKCRLRQTKVTPWSFLLFSQQLLGILIWYFTGYLLKCFTSKCRVKYDSVDKWQSYRFFNVTTLPIFQRSKMFRLTMQPNFYI